MRIDRLDCSAETELHIWSRHRVTIREVEDAAYQHRLAIRGRTEGVYEVFGRTEEGRYLMIVVRHMDGRNVRLITRRTNPNMVKMKKRLHPTDKELREYYDRTSELANGASIRPVKITFPKPRRLVALRLEEETLEGVKRLASRKGLNYSTLMRMWITERLRREDPA